MAHIAPSPVRRRRPASAHSAPPELRLLTRPHSARSNAVTTIGLSLVLTASLVATLLLNVQMSRTSYEITRMQGRVQALSEQRQSLQEQSELLGTPQQLERQARALGMVPAGEIAYIDLAHGTIIGSASAAEGSASPGVSTAPGGDLGGPSIFDYGMGNERN